MIRAAQTPRAVAVLMPICRGQWVRAPLDGGDEFVWVPPFSPFIFATESVRGASHEFHQSSRTRVSFAQSDEDLRAYLVYFDELTYPRVRFQLPLWAPNETSGVWDLFPFAESTTKYLLECGALSVTDIEIAVDEVFGCFKGYGLTFSEFSRRSADGLVSTLRARTLTDPSLILADRGSASRSERLGSSVEITLLDMLPTPDSRIGLGDFIDFRKQHQDTFNRFRKALDQKIARVRDSGDPRELGIACRELLDAKADLGDSIGRRLGQWSAAAIRVSAPVVGAIAAQFAGCPPWAGEIVGGLASESIKARVRPGRRVLSEENASVREYLLKLDGAGLLGD